MFYSIGYGVVGVTIYAFDSDFREVWQLDIAVGAESEFDPNTMALSDTGVLYIAFNKGFEARSEIIAVQTSSPGLAKTPLPMHFHDNQRTGWAK